MTSTTPQIITIQYIGTHAQACTHTCTHAHMHAHTHAHTHTRTHTHTHTHTNIHTSSFLVQPDELDWTNNLALGKPAKQSTTLYNAKASRAVDGDRAKKNTKEQFNCTHSSKSVGNWWEVDLGTVYEIRDVVITNRADCCGKLNQMRSSCVNATLFVISNHFSLNQRVK